MLRINTVYGKKESQPSVKFGKIKIGWKLSFFKSIFIHLFYIIEMATCIGIQPSKQLYSPRSECT